MVKLESLQKKKKRIGKKEVTGVKVTLPKNLTEDTITKTIMFKTFRVEKKLDEIQEKVIKKCLQPIW